MKPNINDIVNHNGKFNHRTRPIESLQMQEI